MATPLAHGLLGVTLARATPPSFFRGGWRWYVFAAVAATAPDLDFIPGLLAGDINRYHQLASHSAGAALIFGMATALVARSRGNPRFARAGLLAGLFYISHLAVDFFCEDRRAPFGQPLFWPLSGEHFIASWTPLGGVRHGVPGDDLASFLRELASVHNLLAAGRELAVFLPPFLIVLLITRSPRGPGGDPRRAETGGGDPCDS